MNGEDRTRLDRLEAKIDRLLELGFRNEKGLAVHEQAEDAHGLKEVKRTLTRWAGALALIVVLANWLVPVVVRMI